MSLMSIGSYIIINLLLKFQYQFYKKMRSLRIQQYKKIKNSPMRSPSPDYACKNKTPRTTQPLNQIQQCNNIIKASPVKFPSVPSELMKKKQSNEGDNMISPRQKYETPSRNTTATPKVNKQISAPNQQIVSFQPIMEEINEIHINEIVNKVQQIYNILFLPAAEKCPIKKRNSMDLSTCIIQTNDKLDQIREQIQKICKLRDNSVSYQMNFNTFGNNQKKHNIEKKIDSIKLPTHDNNHVMLMDSPIKIPAPNQQDSSLSIFQLNQLQTQNSKLRRQVIILKLQLEGSQRRIYSASKLSDLVQKSPSKSSLHSQMRNKKHQTNIMKQGSIKQMSQKQSNRSQTTYKFMKEKIGYLEGELENKIDKVALIEKEKNEEIKVLKDKLNHVNKLLENQMDNYKKVIQSQKNKIKDLEQLNKELDRRKVSEIIINQEKTMSKSRRGRLNSQEINIEHQFLPMNQLKKTNKISQKRGLCWDQEQIVSIYDQEKQESLYSQVQKVDIGQLFSVKKELGSQVQRLKKYYQKVIEQNLNHRYHELYSFQLQVRQLKQFIQSQNLQEYHAQCGNCQFLNNKIIQKQILITDLQVQNNILKEEVEQEKKTGKKIRELFIKFNKIQKTKTEQSQKKFKRKSKMSNQSQIEGSSESNSKIKKEQDLFLGSTLVRFISDQQAQQEQI